MARVWVRSRRVRGGGYWRTTRGSRTRTAQIDRARLKKRRSAKAARRTIAPGSPSVEMGVRHRINRSRGVKDHPAMSKAGQIKIRIRRRSRRRRRG